jgi:hypothetical protein
MKEFILTDPQQAHSILSTLFREDVKAQTMAGHRLLLTLQEAQDDRTIKQNRFLWGFVYKIISEQAQVEGIGATAEGWHHYYKRMFLGYRIAKTRLPGKKRPSITRTLRSTKDLKVKPMSIYLDKVMAHAATTFSVAFPAGISWENYREVR